MPANASDQISVGTVNGENIWLDEVISAAQRLPEEYQQQPLENYFAQLVSDIIDARLAAQAARDAAHDKKPKILSPNASNDFIHVDDVCRAIILAIKKKNISGIFNVGFGKLILVRDIYYTILKLLGKNQTKYKLTSRLYKNSKKENYANIKKIRQKLNFKPKINIIDGINKL